MDFVDFNKPLYKREPLISIRENVNGITISPEVEKLKSTNWRCGGLRGQSPLGEGVESNEVRTRGRHPPFSLKKRRFFAVLSL